MSKGLDIFPRPARDSFELAHRARKGIAAHFESLWMQGWPLRECAKVFDEQSGVENHWFEYVFEDYDGSVEVPLVISFHAGHYFASAQVFDTAWCEIAEREGFIVVFPEASERGCFSTSEDFGTLDFDRIDFRFVAALVSDLKDRFLIDTSRIYIHGMSRGAMFASELAYHMGSELAGMGTSCAASSPDILDDLQGGGAQSAVPLPVVQIRSAFDTGSPYRNYTNFETNLRNRHFWMDVNGCSSVPQISIGSRELVAHYHGDKADLIFHEHAFHNHYEAISDAEDCWALFSTMRRLSDGSLERIGACDAFRADAGAIALGDQSSWALVDNELVQVGAKVRQYRDVNVRKRGGFQSSVWAEATRNELDGIDMCVYYYVPIVFVARVFGLTSSCDGDRATITRPDGGELGFTRGSSAAVVDNHIQNMGQAARIVDGEFCIPIDWFAEAVMGLCTAQKDGVLYIADHQVVLTSAFATIIREQIGWGA